ncbi:two-component system, OmpR family, response regulator [Formivibrio citricus]|uniref:Two-component system, OmpR family, response regulator n=1 Tax=Formivibrio citricus TaxID=83765 RepID=A0A1I4Y7B6_9NEIS|nr:response regulator transcription factor [Formivibrio citricus]SFN33449.1 two-component system, OmpR family, response regulator [Formivibrio citricus]
MATRLFLAEDDLILADALKTSLSQADFQVDCVNDGALALQILLHNDYDVVVLDIGLPNMDGLTVLKSVRQHKPSLPILILTALHGLDERVAGLDAGADDYLAKPFEFAELEARLRALLRRSQILPQSVQQLGSLRLDRAGQRAWCNDTPLDLSARELTVLEILMSNIDRVVTKEQIVAELGNENAEVGLNAIEVYVHRLRKKLDPCGVVIRTIRGLGYLLEKQQPGVQGAAD